VKLLTDCSRLLVKLNNNR